MFGNHADHKLRVEAIIKNINTISLELKKMKGKYGITKCFCHGCNINSRVNFCLCWGVSEFCPLIGMFAFLKTCLYYNMN